MFTDSIPRFSNVSNSVDSIALVQAAGLTQIEVAKLLGRHKSGNQMGQTSLFGLRLLVD